jgi:hypothetical protein
MTLPETFAFRYEIEVGLKNHESFCGSKYFQDCEPNQVVNFVNKQIHASQWVGNLAANLRRYDPHHLGWLQLSNLKLSDCYMMAVIAGSGGSAVPVMPFAAVEKLYLVSTT